MTDWLTDRPTDEPTDQLKNASDKQIMAKTIWLISSLFNVGLSRVMSFHQLHTAALILC